MCRRKDQGGLEISNSRNMNLALISKGIWKISQNDDGQWAKLLKTNYFPYCSFFASDTKGSQIWNGIQKCKESFFLGANDIGDGMDTKFWLSSWSADKPCYVIYRNLYTIAANPQIMVSEVFANGIANIGFLRDLNQVEQMAFDSLQDPLCQFHISSTKDKVSWDSRHRATFW